MPLLEARVAAIYVSSIAGGPMKPCESATAVAGWGLGGDRYGKGQGTFNVNEHPKLAEKACQLTIITSEGIEAANEIAATWGGEYTGQMTRRNIEVKGINPEDLLSLDGRTFFIGGVELCGVGECTPCARPSILLEEANKSRFKTAFADGRGGLKVAVITTGNIHRNDKLVYQTSVLHKVG
ncbi:MAG: MOSC domain-containing protein [Candidatus Levyibacteriota bacterium]